MGLRLLDMFCGSGGAGVGYHRAGFEVFGVDVERQPHYPFEYYQGDVLAYLKEHGHEYDVIHAAPPSSMIHETRNALDWLGMAYVIEGDPDDHLSRKAIRLCPSHFSNLNGIGRSVMFESNLPLVAPTGACYWFDTGRQLTPPEYTQFIGVQIADWFVTEV